MRNYRDWSHKWAFLFDLNHRQEGVGVKALLEICLSLKRDWLYHSTNVLLPYVVFYPHSLVCLILRGFTYVLDSLDISIRPSS